MIKFKGTGPKGLLLGFGLSRENVRRLQAGQPILVDLAELELPAGELLIMFGETEADLMRQLDHLMEPDTRVHVDPDLGGAGPHGRPRRWPPRN